MLAAKIPYKKLYIWVIGATSSSSGIKLKIHAQVKYLLKITFIKQKILHYGGIEKHASVFSSLVMACLFSVILKCVVTICRQQQAERTMGVKEEHIAFYGEVPTIICHLNIYFVIQSKFVRCHHAGESSSCCMYSNLYQYTAFCDYTRVLT